MYVCMWPVDIAFAGINNSRSRPRLEQLLAILEAFKNSKEAANHEDQAETMEDDDNEPDARSPVIPIPQCTSASTAQTSSTPTQTLSAPVQSSSTPAQTSAGSTPSQFTSTPTQSLFHICTIHNTCSIHVINTFPISSSSEFSITPHHITWF